MEDITASPTGPKPNGHAGSVAPLVVVIATGMANAHGTGQYTTGLITIALVLIHDAVTRKH